MIVMQHDERKGQMGMMLQAEGEGQRGGEAA